MSVARKGCSAQDLVKETDVKICALCGTLNHKKNTECYTCGWQGAYDTDPRTLHLAWLRIYEEFEAVRYCHVSGSKSVILSEFGVTVPNKPLSGFSSRLSDWWSRVKSSFRRGSVHPDPRMRTHGNPHNELGV